MLTQFNDKNLKWIIYLIVGLGLAIAVGLVILSIAGDTSEKPQGRTMPVKTDKGDIQVRNVFQNPVEQTQDAVVVAIKQGFKIVYFPTDEAFLISLEQSPLRQIQAAAETEFLNNLKISRQDACLLTVTIAVSAEADIQHAGKNYPLSFCPGGTSF